MSSHQPNHEAAEEAEQVGQVDGEAKAADDVWDKDTQTFHGGQSWRKCGDQFVEDFSVTTNGLGTPASGMAAARDALQVIDHYPAADFEPALSDLAHFIWPRAEEEREGKAMLLAGNGASELIDLVIRDATRNGTWKPGPQVTQYKEYARSAGANGFTEVPADDLDADLLCMVNPTNPTGDYMSVEEIKTYIEDNTTEGCTVVVDESMQPWLGPDWREDSLLHQRAWTARMTAERDVKVWVITSWTKLWSCAGIRLGSIVAPTVADLRRLKSHQVPWSVNCIALAFLSAVCRDTEYLERTWQVTSGWNAEMRLDIAERFPQWRVAGKPFLSWLWIDTGDENVAEYAVQLAEKSGVPVRWGKPGYEMPTFVRLAVRPREKTAHLWRAWNTMAVNVAERAATRGTT